MSYHIDEHNGDIIYEIHDENQLVLKVSPDVFPAAGEEFYVIKSKDGTLPSDSNVFSAKRTLLEIANLGSLTLDHIDDILNNLSNLEIEIITTEYGNNSNGQPSDLNVFSALRTLEEIQKKSQENIKKFDNRYLRKDIDDTAIGLITFVKGIQSKGYVPGFGKDAKGWKLDADTGYSEFMGAGFRGDVLFGKGLSSSNFSSGFFGGKGWALLPYKQINAAGVEETLYKLEIDSVTVRKNLTVFELVINQLRGMNDNFVFAGQMKVSRIEGNRIYLDTEKGQMYNPFREGDILIVQQFGGMPTEVNDYNIIKSYELRVTKVGIGKLEDKEKREDWIEFSNFVGDIAQVKKRDVLTRVDSVSNSNRKGVVTVTTIDEFGAPYIDIVYGMKTEDNPIKSRFGRLEGLVTPYWGRLKGYGLMSDNAYLKGEFRLATGEDVATKFDITEGLIRSEVASVKRYMSEKDNILSNPTFRNEHEKWILQNTEPLLYKNNEKLLWINGAYYGYIKDTSYIDKEGNLRIKNATIKQLNKDLNKENITGDEHLYSISFEYKCIKNGILKVGFQETELFAELNITKNEWTSFEHFGKWDSHGDFIIDCSGDVLIRFLAVTTNALENYKLEVKTKFEQTDEKLGLYGERIDTLNQTAISFRNEIDTVNGQINLISEKYDALNASKIEQGLQIDALNDKVSLFSTKFEDYNNLISNLRLDLDNANETINLTGQKVTILDNSLLNFKNSVNAQFQDVVQNISYHATELNNHNASLADLRASVQHIGLRIDNIDSSLHLFARHTDLTGKYIIDRINLPSTTIKISANKINLEGAVRYSMLHQDVRRLLDENTLPNWVKNNSSVRKALESETIIAGGFINTDLIRLKEGMYIGGKDEITNTGLKIGEQGIDGSAYSGLYRYLFSPRIISFTNNEMKTEARLGGNVLPISSGLSSCMLLKYTLDVSHNFVNNPLESLIILRTSDPKNIYNAQEITWIDASSSWGALFKVGAYWDGSMPRTIIRVGTTIYKNQISRFPGGGSEGSYSLRVDKKTGIIFMD